MYLTDLYTICKFGQKPEFCRRNLSNFAEQIVERALCILVQQVLLGDFGATVSDLSLQKHLNPITRLAYISASLGYAPQLIVSHKWI
jgi:hypothetical protein